MDREEGQSYSPEGRLVLIMLFVSRDTLQNAFRLPEEVE